MVKATCSFDDRPASFKIEKTDGSIGAYKITTAEQEGSSYLTVFYDGLSPLGILGLIGDPTQAFLFFKYNEDVVATV